MDKPKGTFKCRACGDLWDGSQLFLAPRLTGTTWTCGFILCGGTVDRVSNTAKAVPKLRKDKDGILTFADKEMP